MAVFSVGKKTNFFFPALFLFLNRVLIGGFQEENLEGDTGERGKGRVGSSQLKLEGWLGTF